MPPRAAQFHPIDVAIVVAYLVGVFAVGLRFSRRQTSTERYFAAKRSIPGWAMGLSLFATIITSISFIAYPGGAYAGNWAELVSGFMVPAALVVVATVVIPFFRRAVGLSAYEYFERRFGYSIRVYSSLIFAVGNLLKMGFIIYLLSLTVGSLTGWNVNTVILVATGGTVVYTLIGGVEAVIWADVVQGIILWVGLVAVLIELLVLPPGGPGAALRLAWASHKISLGYAGLDFTRRGVAVMCCYGFFFYLQKFTADQTVVQRYLVAESDAAAIKGAAFGSLLCIPVWALFLLIGSLTWSFYRLTGEPLPARIAKADQIFPYFLSTHLPVGLFGMIVASLLASAMGGISSDLNCLAVIGVEDYYRRLRPRATDQTRLRLGKALVGVVAALGAAVALTLGRHARTALPLYFTATSILAGGLFGLFFLAFATRRANVFGAWVGIVACLLFSAYATLTLGQDRWVDFGSWNFALQSVMIGAIGHVVLIAVGWTASLLRPGGKPADPAMTFWGLPSK